MVLHRNSEPFQEQTNPHDLNTKLALYSDPHFILVVKVVTSSSRSVNVQEFIGEVVQVLNRLGQRL